MHQRKSIQPKEEQDLIRYKLDQDVVVTRSSTNMDIVSTPIVPVNNGDTTTTALRSHQKVAFSSDSKLPSRENRVYALLWCASSSFYFILLKSILNIFPYPIFLTVVVLGTQTLYSFLRWELGISKGPSFSKLRRRHVTRLLWAAFLHGMATLALNHCVLAGPLTLTILLKLLPFSYSAASLLQWGISLAIITNAKHLTLALLANLGFAARSQIRTSTQRFHGGHNVFQLTVACSFFIPTLPLYFLLEHNQVILHWQTANMDTNQMNSFFPTFWIGVLGILYCIGNDLGAVVPQFDIHRRLVTWAFGALLLGEHLRLIDVVGAFSIMLLHLYRKRYDTHPSKSNLNTPSNTSRRNRTHSGESFGSTSWNSIRSF